MLDVILEGSSEPLLSLIQVKEAAQGLSTA